MKFNKIIAVINIFLLIILAGIIMPLTVKDNNYIKGIIIVTFIIGLVVSFALLYKEDRSDIVDKYYKVKGDLQESISNYEEARLRLVTYVLESFNGLYTSTDMEDAFVEGFHCEAKGKPLDEYAQDYLTKIKNEKKSN